MAILRFLPSFILLAIPYLLLQFSLNEAFFSGGVESFGANVLRIVKFLAYASFAAGGMLLFSRSRIALILVGVVVGLVYLALGNYHDYHDVVPHWQQLGHLDEAQNVVGHVQAQLIGWADIVSVICLVLGVGWAMWRRPSRLRWCLYAMIPGVLLLSIQLVRRPIVRTVDSSGYTMGVSHYGILPTYLVMLKDFLPREPRIVPKPPAKMPPPSEYAGSLEGGSVIIIQVESLDQALVEDGTVLAEIPAPAARFTNGWAMHAGGGSSDAELSSLLGLVPLVSTSGMANADWNRVEPLSRVLKEANYYSVAFHPNRAGFYDRGARYEEMGFDHFYDLDFFTGEASGWYARDDAFLTQSFAEIRELPQPFLAYLITMQSHGPFENYRDRMDGVPESEVGLRSTFQEVDTALRDFLEAVETAFPAENERPLVIIFGDHGSGYFPKTDEGDEAIPFVLVHPIFEGFGTSDKKISHVDMASTLTELLGLPTAASWLGESIFAEGEGQIFRPTDYVVPEVNYSRALLGR